MPTRAPPPRRGFLKLAALLPVAAACASVRPGAPASAAAQAAPPTPSQSLEAVRAFPLAPEAEPALIFRARGARGRGP